MTKEYEHFSGEDIQLITILYNRCVDDRHTIIPSMPRYITTTLIANLVDRLKQIAKIMYQIDVWRNGKKLSEKINEIDYLFSSELTEICSKLNISWERTSFDKRAKDLHDETGRWIFVHPPFLLIIGNGIDDNVINCSQFSNHDHGWAFSLDLL